MFYKALSIFVISLFLGQQAQANFDFNANCVQAYKNILALRLNEGKALIDKERVQHPQNAVTVLLDNYYDFFFMLTNGSKADFDRLKQNKSKRIDRLENDDSKSPYYNFSIAQVNLQWALLRSHYGEYATAGFEINKAYRLLQNNTKKFPQFLPDYMPLGVVNVLLGSLPGGALKTILNFLGIKGDTQTGIKMLENLSAELPRSGYAYQYNELIYYLTYIQSDVMNDPLAYNKMLKLMATSDTTSLLNDYIAGYIALRTGHSSEAITALNKRHQGKEYISFPYLEYLIGLARMNRGDADANNYFNQFLQTNRGVSFIKDAYLHLAWQCLLEGDTRRYNGFLQFVKTKGSLYNDKDKQALDEANDTAPDVTLLKARLLYDGGYYAKAIATLAGKSVNDFALERDKIEYYYRVARIYDAQDNDDAALKYYQITINTGKNSKYHYAATSALKMGLIYEQRKDYSKARASYKMVSDMNNEQFKNSLDQKASEGLKRVGNK